MATYVGIGNNFNHVLNIVIGQKWHTYTRQELVIYYIVKRCFPYVYALFQSSQLPAETINAKNNIESMAITFLRI